jgi:hypothetical protein
MGFITLVDSISIINQQCVTHYSEGILKPGR